MCSWWGRADSVIRKNNHTHLYRVFFFIRYICMYYFISLIIRTLAISKTLKIGNGPLAWSHQSHRSRIGNGFPFGLRNKVSLWFFLPPCYAGLLYVPCSYLDHWNTYSSKPSKRAVMVKGIRSNISNLWSSKPRRICFLQTVRIHFIMSLSVYSEMFLLIHSRRSLLYYRATGAH